MINIESLAEKLIEQNRNQLLKKNNNDNINNNDKISKNNFKFLCVIGKGGFGRVWKIQSKKTKEVFALKEMSKLKIIDKKSEKSINTEREFLSKLNHPFIVNMHYAFQDKDNLYLVMDMLSGGDLRYHVSRYRKFSEEQTRFFIANMTYALQYIHSHNVIHRDIKPENLVLDDKGYVRITDFGIAKENMPDNSSETSGTPGYMAPEVMKAKNHSFSVDFFAIGVIGYEFMLGRRPYYGKNRKEIKEQMLSKAAVIKEENIAHGWSADSADFINLLLKRKEEKRLGYKNGASELMNHPWLKYYPWSQLKNKTLLAPFVPEKIDNFDKRYCESIDKISEETQMRYEEIYLSSYFKNAFANFFFNGDDEKEKKKKQMEEQERKEKEEKEEKDKIEKEEKEKEQTELILKEIEDSEKLLQIEKRQHELNKSLNERNVNYNFFHDLKGINSHNNNIKNNNNNLLLKRSRKFLLQENNNNSMNSKKSRTNYNTNKNKNKTNDKNVKERLNESSMNLSRKLLENKNSKIKNLKNLKKPLTRSNSTKDIYTVNSNIKKYLSKKINLLKNNTNNPNISNMQVKPVIKHPSSKSKKTNNNSNLAKTALKGGSSANIHINNYYTNNIYNSIYNNYMPHKIISKNEKKSNNNTNKVNNNNNVKHQRASSVLSSKKHSSKFKTYKKNDKKEKNSNIINKDNRGLSSKNRKSMSRTNSSNKVNLRPNSEYIFNKMKSISMYNQV